MLTPAWARFSATARLMPLSSPRDEGDERILGPAVLTGTDGRDVETVGADGVHTHAPGVLEAHRAVDRVAEDPEASAWARSIEFRVVQLVHVDRTRIGGASPFDPVRPQDSVEENPRGVQAGLQRGFERRHTEGAHEGAPRGRSLQRVPPAGR